MGRNLYNSFWTVSGRLPGYNRPVSRIALKVFQGLIVTRRIATGHQWVFQFLIAAIMRLALSSFILWAFQSCEGANSRLRITNEETRLWLSMSHLPGVIGRAKTRWASNCA